MSAHLSEQQIEDYRQRKMAPGELLFADDHLAACEECRRRVGRDRKLLASIANLRTDLLAAADNEPEHLLYEQIEAYVDDKLNEVDREVIDTHLELCLQCKAEVEDLFAFKATLTTHTARESAKVSAREFALPEQRSMPSLWERFLNFWQKPYSWVPLQAAGLAAIALFSIWIGKQMIDLRGQVNELQQTNNALQKKVSTVSDLQQQVAQLENRVSQIGANGSGSTDLEHNELIALNDGGKI